MFSEITIQLTERCNIQCSYCFASLKSKNILSQKDFEIFKIFCKSNLPDVIHITGGEPTLHPHFVKYVTELAEISSVLVYSNFTVNNVIDKIYSEIPSEIVFLVNTNSRYFCTRCEYDTLIKNIEKALEKGFRVALSYTFYLGSENIESEFDFLINKMRHYKLRNLRVSQAVSFDNNRSFMNGTDIKKLYHYVAEQVSAWNEEGFSVYFDCPVPPCYIDYDDFKKLRSHNAVSTKCLPKALVMWNLNLTHCYCTMESHLPKRQLSDFNSICEAKEYSKKLLEKIYKQNNRAGCCTCIYGNNGTLCGCPAYST